MPTDEIRDVLKRYWGFEEYLPLQQEAIDCVLEHRDSLEAMLRRAAYTKRPLRLSSDQLSGSSGSSTTARYFFGRRKQVII